MHNSSFDQNASAFITSFSYIMAITTYFLAALISPSQSNLDIYLKEHVTHGKKFHIDKKEFNNRCEFCKMNKHDRTSHCSYCSCCILRRDHHCVFIGNCVGFKNTRFFLNFLIWSLVNYLLSRLVI